MRLQLLLLPFAAMCSVAAAQTSVFIPDAKADSGRCTTLPFGSFTQHPFATNQKYQTLVSWEQLRKLSRPVIEEIGFAACEVGIHRFDTIVIRMDQVSTAALLPEFGKNVGVGATTVLASKDYYWHHAKDQWSRIGLQAPYRLVAGKNLVIDIEVTGAVYLDPNFGQSTTDIGSFRMADNLPRLYALDWNVKPPSKGVRSPLGLKLEIACRASALGVFGIGCKGSGGVAPAISLDGKPTPGGGVNARLANGIAYGPTLLVLGFNSNLPFPLEMGFPGCSLYESLDIALAMVADANGSAVVPLGIPQAPVLHNQRFYVQYFQVEVATPKLGLRASNYGRVLID